MPDREPSALPPVIAIDGPGGSGKGTISLRLARELGWNFLDSGALYRLVALAAMNRGIEPDNEIALAELAAALDAQFGMDAEGPRVTLDGEDVTGQLRSESVSAFSSHVAAHQAVREALVGRQQAFREPPGLVADGRDMGTVIFPDAEYKFFLTASVEERAQRRYKQLKEKGESVTLSRLFREIEKRDERDMTREIAPLVPADDAVTIDSTRLSVDEVMRAIYDVIEIGGARH
ncbi:MAG: (d)CMP kinase [Xanthomonadales bacterium]|nr:(d)CMP kinase [Xanthomonadales bacterium]